MTRDPLSPPWEDCKVCGGDHWTKDHPSTHDTPEAALAAARWPDGAFVITPVQAKRILAAMPPGWCGHEAEIADAQRWRDAEAEGHIVTFSASGYGLQHPPSCRPDLIGCKYNRYLASKSEADRRPGRYRMTLDNMVAKYARAALVPSEPPGSGRG